ncbi:YwqJ-related putative deaminase [Acinetobacter pollinis]|uniref:Uncharacterized protein n=1 Tax=Acinetobacter pollinis TaxID=2605270 RepID=A0ABU6DVN6_9GAMM|nr:YwqJ-related putative deaminase [Acinetobacter pollinis]MEB5477531.1 hypothetical protein [Acinetobacter pollinis]
MQDEVSKQYQADLYASDSVRKFNSVYLYPRDSAGNINPGYGAYPNAYNQIVENTPEAIDKLRSDSSRGANAILGMGNSVIAAGSYLGAKSFGADKATQENIAIGTALGSLTLGSGIAAKGNAFEGTPIGKAEVIVPIKNTPSVKNSVLPEVIEGVGSSTSIIGLSKSKANELINDSSLTKKNKSSMAAVAVAGDSTRGIQTDTFINTSLFGSNQDKQTKNSQIMPSYKQLKLDETIQAIDDHTFRILNVDQYMDKLKNAYQFTGNPMNDFTASRIENYIREKQAFKITDGLPGAHAEIQAFNSLYNLSPLTKKENANIATYKLGPSNPDDKQGGTFRACTNCSGILPEESNIPTRRK